MSVLYVPLHKRASSSCSSRESSAEPHLQPTYTIETLLALAHSPSSSLPPHKRDELRAAFPDLVTNRKQRKAIEYHNHIQQQARRVRPLAQRTPPAERKRNATRVVDEVSWRGRVPPRGSHSVVPVPMNRAVAAAA